MTDPNRFAVATVLYQPPAVVLERMARLSAAGYPVYVFDNSPEDALASAFREQTGFRYFTVGKNVGLGYALSAVFSQAYYDGHAAVLFFDQDTGFENATLDFIAEVWRSSLNSAENYSAISFSADAPRAASFSSDPRCIHPARFIINSGTLFFLDRVKHMGWIDTRYFVDLVDYDFCLRSAIAGYSVGKVYCTPGFDHVTEQADVEYRVFGRFRRLRVYGAKRIWTSLLGYAGLLMLALANRQMGYFVALTRSASIYCYGQIMARAARILLHPANAQSPSNPPDDQPKKPSCEHT